MSSSNRDPQSSGYSSTTSATSSAAKSLPARLSESAMETLWERMTAIYLHRWTSAVGENVAGVSGDTWSAGLAGLSGEQLGRGLKSCITSADPWPPTLPQFRAMCLGIPSLESVRAEVNANGRATQVRSPFAMLVWDRIDGFNYWQADAKAAGAMLKSAYEAAREHVMSGGELPEPRMAIAAPDGSSAKIAERVAYIRQQHGYGVYGEGEAADLERDRLIEEARKGV